jgi:hypothetical protein
MIFTCPEGAPSLIQGHLDLADKAAAIDTPDIKEG